MTDNNVFSNGYNCCQAVLDAYAPSLHVPGLSTFKIGAAFGGGMGRRGHVCGAVSGALMVIGLWYASADPEDKQMKDLVYSKAQSFLDRFSQAHGSIYCRELLGKDFAIPGEYDRAHEENLFNRVCPTLVEGAIGILSEYIET